MSLTGRQFVFKDTIGVGQWQVLRNVDSQSQPLFISGGTSFSKMYGYSGNLYYGINNELVYSGSTGYKWSGREQYKKIKFIAEPTRYMFENEDTTEEAFLTWLLSQANEIIELNYIVLPDGSMCYLVPDMGGATAQSSGTSGRVPAPSAGDENKALLGNGTWGIVDSLPTVSSSDNGKFLRVVSGEWAAATVPNANGVSF